MSGDLPVEPLKYSAAALKKRLGADWENLLRAAHRWMVLGRTLDTRMTALQRQGRVGFYGPATGQEAVNVATGLATVPEDWISPGLREQLVALVRGHSLLAYVHQLFADQDDPAQGRQMPCHPTARDVHQVSMSSVVGTQITHAVGLGYAIKFRKAPGVSFAFFGDGGTSANDFHAGLNFAGVFDLPVVFCCTNNQWAISVPTDRQSKVPHFADKARAYGFAGETLDGTDFVEVYRALKQARDKAAAGGGPTLLEFVIYRMAPHSSSDDPSRYQPAGWARQANVHDPLARLEQLMTEREVLTPTLKEETVRRAEEEVRAAVAIAEQTPPPPDATMLTDVFAPPTAAPQRG